MKKQSAGLLVFRMNAQAQPEVLLAHPGGPFWAKKDEGAWTLPKGEYEPDEEPLLAAKREFQEELGFPPPAGEYASLGEFTRRDGKTIKAWAIAGDLDVSRITSNTFDMEWPPKSGKRQAFPEVDRAGWFSLAEAARKLSTGQPLFLERLAEKLGVELPDTEGFSQQQLL